MHLTFRQIAEMTGGEIVQGGDVTADSVVIDSREVKPDSAFFAIKGDRLDGHQFVTQALATGRGAVVSQVPANAPADKAIVRVADTTAALQNLARSIRERYPFTLIGITGSAGKTTTKEMIATLVGSEKRTFKSWGNFNNLIGCPLCIDNTPDDAEVGVVLDPVRDLGSFETAADVHHVLVVGVDDDRAAGFDVLEELALCFSNLLDGSEELDVHGTDVR
ncbi:MAG: hypothetical protein JO231_14210, partial [Acidobacteria bacterium]|nr:hypothetical protein [Acidobacteriota bacterium]